jgi:hypothetical protein
MEEVTDPPETSEWTGVSAAQRTRRQTRHGFPFRSTNRTVTGYRHTQDDPSLPIEAATPNPISQPTSTHAHAAVERAGEPLSVTTCNRSSPARLFELKPVALSLTARYRPGALSTNRAAIMYRDYDAEASF